MHGRLIIASTCPTCSAPLDFSEGAHAVQCPYCRSNLLITGHKQVLSYTITMKITAQQAVAHVEHAWQECGTPCRVRNIQCHFVPYYRFTGQDLRWQQGSKHSSLRSLSPSMYEAVIGPTAKQPSRGIGAFSLGERYVEKSFLACALPGLGAHSLGVRPAVLRLEPFQPECLAALGSIVPVSIGVKEALICGMQTPTPSSLTARLVLGKMLSVIYFPYWIAEREGPPGAKLTVVDAVTGTIVTHEAPVSLLEGCKQEAMTTARVVAFRPLVCPNCGWDLPLTPDATVFVCAACERAWHIMGSELHATAYDIAELPTISSNNVAEYLPFWILRPKAGAADAVPHFLPAFRYRRLKLLVDFGRRMTEMQPHYTGHSGLQPTSLRACFYDQGDATRLAHFLHKATRPRGRPRVQGIASQPLSFASATLTWFPFTRQGRYLIDPLTKLSLHENVLLS